jgi:hypothetical protein
MAHYRITKRWKSTFARFVMGFGVERLATRLDVRSSAIYHWIGGRTAPRPVHAAIIRRLAREAGIKLTFDHIYRRFLEQRAACERESAAPNFRGTAAPREEARVRATAI